MMKAWQLTGALKFNFRDVQIQHTSLYHCLATGRATISRSYYCLLLKGFRTAYNYTAYFAKPQLLGWISWRSKSAQRRSLFLFSHNPHTNVYLNILQLQQSRTSTFKSRLCGFISLSTVLQWCSDSQSLADPALAVVIAHYRGVWPVCHTPSCCLSLLCACRSPWLYQELSKKLWEIQSQLQRMIEISFPNFLPCNCYFSPPIQLLASGV